MGNPSGAMNASRMNKKKKTDAEQAVFDARHAEIAAAVAIAVAAAKIKSDAEKADLNMVIHDLSQQLAAKTRKEKTLSEQLKANKPVHLFRDTDPLPPTASKDATRKRLERLVDGLYIRT